jgi:hypothetical protein
VSKYDVMVQFGTYARIRGVEAKSKNEAMMVVGEMIDAGEITSPTHDTMFDELVWDDVDVVWDEDDVEEVQS